MKTSPRCFLPVLVLAILLSAGCSSSKNFYLEDQYQNGKEDTSVMILPLDREYFPENYEYTFGHFNTDQEQVFRSTAEVTFSQTAGVPTYLFSGDSVNSDMFRPSELETGNSSFEVLTPTDASGIQAGNNSGNPGFVLLLDGFTFDRETVTVEGSGYAGHEQSAKFVLVFETRYLYWNPRTSSTAGWGTVRSSIDLEGQNPTRDEYSEVLADVMRTIAQNGPVQGANP